MLVLHPSQMIIKFRVLCRGNIELDSKSNSFKKSFPVYGNSVPCIDIENIDERKSYSRLYGIWIDGYPYKPPFNIGIINISLRKKFIFLVDRRVKY